MSNVAIVILPTSWEHAGVGYRLTLEGFVLELMNLTRSSWTIENSVAFLSTLRESATRYGSIAFVVFDELGLGCALRDVERSLDDTLDFLGGKRRGLWSRYDPHLLTIHRNLF